MRDCIARETQRDVGRDPSARQAADRLHALSSWGSSRRCCRRSCASWVLRGPCPRRRAPRPRPDRSLARSCRSRGGRRAGSPFCFASSEGLVVMPSTARPAPSRMSSRWPCRGRTSSRVLRSSTRVSRLAGDRQGPATAAATLRRFARGHKRRSELGERRQHEAAAGEPGCGNGQLGVFTTASPNRSRSRSRTRGASPAACRAARGALERAQSREQGVRIAARLELDDRVHVPGLAADRRRAARCARATTRASDPDAPARRAPRAPAPPDRSRFAPTPM